MAKLKISKNLPVHVVEQHNDVVQILHRAIASRLLPFSGVPVVHFDSHPDLLIPINLEADVVFQPQVLYESISIENWLMPLVYAKHFDHIIWVKPPWAHQIEASEKSFSIGKCRVSGKLRLSSKENYFLTEGLFCPANSLAEASPVKLTVVELVPDRWSELESSNSSTSLQVVKKCSENKKECASICIPEQNCFQDKKEVLCLQDFLSNKPYVLDIDLDFFSTANPFKDMLHPDEEEALRRVYQYPALTDDTDEKVAYFTQIREKQLNLLEIIFSDLETRWFVENTSYSESELQNFSLADFVGQDTKDINLLDYEQQTALKFLCRNLLLHKKERDITFNVLHHFGCTLDDTELPHHISTSLQISALMTSFRNALEQLPKPTVVTIARSSDDGYCPKDVVDQLEADVLKILEILYGSLTINKFYE